MRTALAALLPWRFWRTVSLEVPIEQRRVKWWLIACILLPIATMIVLGFGVYALDAATVGGRISPRAPLGGRVAPPGFLLTALREFAEYEARVLDPRYMRAWLASFFALAIIMPIVLVCLPATRAIASIRLAQVLRAATYAFAFAVPIVFYGFATTMLRMYAYFTSNWDLKMRARQLDPYCAASQSMDAPQWLWILVIAWFILWWACALKIGFRMKEWRLTLIAMLVPALIAGLLLMHMNFDFSVTNVW